MDTVKIENSQGLHRDLDSKAIIRDDSKALLAAKARKALAVKEQQRLSDLEDKVDGLNNSINQILDILKSNQ